MEPAHLAALARSRRHDLARLDRILQTAMGWTNSHLHTFTAGGMVYADARPEWEIDVRNERRARLGGIACEEGEAFIYDNDLGDSWRHQVLVEEVQVDAGAGMIGGPFDPDAFALDAVNRALKALRAR